MRGGYERKCLRKTFLGDGHYGIPSLIEDKLCTTTPDHLEIYRAGKNVADGNSALCFFVHDFRFECAWSYPTRMTTAMAAKGWRSVCEPDFSVLADRPHAEQVWNTYRARWCGRLFQEAGFDVIPCPNWSTEASFDFVWCGIPVGVPIVAVESQTCSDKDAWRIGFRAMCKRLQPGVVLIYGNEFDVGCEVDVKWYKPRRYRGKQIAQVSS